MSVPSERGARVLVALDVAQPRTALELADRLDPALCRLKVGKELFTRGGPETVRALVARGYEVFLDLKYHDIPNTVAGALRAAADLGVWMVDVHLLGGRSMLEAARRALEDAGPPVPLLIGVTLLTSLAERDLSELGIGGPLEDAVLRLAALAEDCGLDGVVCSPLEIARLRAERRAGFRLVTPGIRPAGTVADDQKRIMTPSEALRLGADFLVIGRPITASPDPRAALEAVLAELGDGR